MNLLRGRIYWFAPVMLAANVAWAAAQSVGAIHIPETAATIDGEPISGKAVLEGARKELDRIEAARIQFEATLERDKAVAVPRRICSVKKSK